MSNGFLGQLQERFFQAFVKNADRDYSVQVVGTTGGPAIAVVPGNTTSTPTTTRVSSSASSVTLKAANTNRRGLTIFNESTQILYVSYTTPATATNYIVQLAPNNYWEMPQPITTVAVYGIWVAANGAAQITEAV